ncbi:MAG: DsrE family protein [Halobacteriales archaeon]|nr:DsrE family protein [Halobacteriales archaeon]
MKRDVLVMLTRAPERVHAAEGLRAARGVAAGFDEHDVTVLFTEDAVYAARRAVDRDALNLPDHIAELHAGGGRMVADGAALEARGIDPSEIADDIEVLDGGAAAGLVHDADHTLDF